HRDFCCFFFSSRRRHTRSKRDWSSDVCSSDLEISIGDYVLTGGEISAMVVVDSVVRLLPEVLGNQESASQDSFSTGFLEHPHYTRPASFRGLNVPDVLLSGNHERIREWRLKESLKRTYLRRRDLLENKDLSEYDQSILDDIINDMDSE